MIRRRLPDLEIEVFGTTVDIRYARSRTATLFIQREVAQMFRVLQLPLLLGVFAATSFAIAHDNPAEHELHDLLDRFLAGASTNDVEMHDRFWAEDLVYTSSSGERFGKAEIMAGLAEPPPPDDVDQPVYSSEDVNIRLFEDIAVVTFRLVAADLAQATGTEFFNTGVFQQRDGQWKAFTWQATRIPSETAD